MKQNKVLLIDNRALHSQKSNFETEKNELIADHNESQSALGRRNQSKIQLKLNEDRTWWTILQDFILAGDEKIIVLETQLLVKDEMIRGLILANSGLSFQLDLARDALVQVRDDLVKKEREIKSHSCVAGKEEGKLKENEQEEMIALLREELDMANARMASVGLAPDEGQVCET